MALSDLLQFVFVWMIHLVEYTVITQIMAVTAQACMKTAGYHINMPTSTHSSLLHHPHLQWLRLSTLSTLSALHPLWKQLFFFFFCELHVLRFLSSILKRYAYQLHVCGCVSAGGVVPSGHWYLQHGGVWCARGEITNTAVKRHPGLSVGGKDEWEMNGEVTDIWLFRLYMNWHNYCLRLRLVRQWITEQSQAGVCVVSQIMRIHICDLQEKFWS